jgi:hypothetical protein
VDCTPIQSERQSTCPSELPWQGAKRRVSAHPERAVCVPGKLERWTLASMSFLPCSNCGQRPQGKLAAAYAWWFDENGERESWRNRFCAVCLTTLLGSLKSGASADSPDLTACPMCGCDSSAELNGVWLTIYPPKQPEREYALPMCASCAASLRHTLSENGERMGDRNARAAALADSPASDWAQIPW